jgi:hypothetical protein
VRFLRVDLAIAGLFLLACILPVRAFAVVTLGATSPDLNALAPTGALANSGWQYAGLYGQTNATAIAPNWVLVAEHWRVSIPNVSTITLNGVSHTVDNVNYVRIGTTDMTLLKVSDQLPTFAPLSTSTVNGDRNKAILDIGRGKDPGAPVIVNGVTKGWYSGLTNNRQRWGTNTTSSQSLTDFVLGNFLLTTFDAAGGPNEMSLDVGDSGGPLFVQEGGTWKLAGLNYSVYNMYSLSATGASPFAANIFDPTGLYDNSNGGFAPATHGTMSTYSHVGSSYALISAATGVSIWTGNSSATQTWTGANWGGALAPNGVDKTAEFTNANALGGAISVNQPITLGTLVLASGTTATNAGLSYNITGPNAITFDVGSNSSNATLRVDQGTHTISAPITANYNLNFDINGTQLTLSGGINNPFGSVLVKTGSGDLQLTGPWTNGIGSQFVTAAGTTTITQDLGSNTLVFVKGGSTLSFTSSQHLAGVTINSGGTLVAPSAANGVLVANSLTMNGGKLDLGVNDLIIHATAATKASVYASTLASVKTGFAGGQWNGNGIISSNAATLPFHLTTFATQLNDNGSGGSFFNTFDGETVGVNDVIVRYTWYGDADMNGVVNSADFALLMFGYNHHLTGWRNGDFNGDGVVSGADFALFDDTYNFYGGVPLGVQNFIALEQSMQLVPEPGSLSLAMFGAVAALVAGLHWHRQRANHRTAA